MSDNYRYLTERLLVDEWHSFSADEWPEQNLVATVKRVMTEPVTAFLPADWQGAYTQSRAASWIEQRDAEGVTLQVVDTDTHGSIGLVILFDPDNNGHLRLGYMLQESAWGKGYASELVRGFVEWCRHNGVKLVTGGVERGNVASRRILEKSGFTLLPETRDLVEQLFRIEFP